MNFLSENFYIDLLVSVLFLFLFFKEKDLLRKQVAFYLLCFMVFVVFSELIFGKQYSRNHSIFNTSLDDLKFIFYIFSLFFFCLTMNLKKVPDYKIKSFSKIKLFDFLVAAPIAIFIIYYLNDKGVRLTGEFLEHRGERSVWVDYMYVYTIVCLVSLKGSIVIMVMAIIIAVAHLLAAERMRAFVYLMSYLIIFYKIYDKRIQSSLVLLLGFTVATFVGAIRHGADRVVDETYNVTHFGSVTVSSLYLMDQSYYFSIVDEVRFAVGIFMANILPSSIMSESYNIRHYIFSTASIPGGGWLPIWFYAIGSYFGIVFLAVLIACMYRWMLNIKSLEYSSAKDLAKYTMLIIFLATLPRWFMYTPFQVIKMPLYGFVGTYLMVKFIKNLSKGRK